MMLLLKLLVELWQVVVGGGATKMNEDHQSCGGSRYTPLRGGDGDGYTLVDEDTRRHEDVPYVLGRCSIVGTSKGYQAFFKDLRAFCSCWYEEEENINF
ncbi:hypothetical protein HAX54_023238 [Datura stramonium]|uniref:Uncharacterized protein n=1 Tax=Datura stramonium TaxID=4076 RepID=A0ABS8UY66_DATST|nr:hypothetical protein [Datura stramonium]